MQFCALFLEFGVADAGMVDGLQLLDEDGLGVGDVSEGDWTVLETTVGHLPVDKPFYKFADALLSIVRQ